MLSVWAAVMAVQGPTPVSVACLDLLTQLIDTLRFLEPTLAYLTSHSSVDESIAFLSPVCALVNEIEALTMIDPQERLWAGGGNLLIGGPYTWYITDFDQRRHFSVTYAPATSIQDPQEIEATEDICLAKLRRHIDDLGADVLGIHFSNLDGPFTASTDKDDDVTWTIGTGSLTELDRLGPQVDLVTYQGDPMVDGAMNMKVAFKYWFMENGMFRKWFELQCWSRLPRNHPHIVPFDAVVVDDARGGVVGFTSLYIPGGTLQDNNATTRPFRLVWLQQLLSVVDDLNYRYGIMHQDIAARNLLIDEKENLRIFDFNYSIMIHEHYAPERDDIKGVIFTLYEIMTLDEHFRDVPHPGQDAEALLQLEWVKHPDVKLDSDLQAFRDVLDIWIAKRRGREFELGDTCVQWPIPMPQAPPARAPVKGPDGAITSTEIKSCPVLPRSDLRQMSDPYFDWERPASYRLKEELKKKGR